MINEAYTNTDKAHQILSDHDLKITMGPRGDNKWLVILRHAKSGDVILQQVVELDKAKLEDDD